MSTSILIIILGLTLFQNVFSQACGEPSPLRDNIRSFIPGDDRVKQGDFPWMVEIMKRKNDGTETPLCAGFLIDSRHVLTAAQCFFNKEAGLHSIRAGDIYFANGTKYEVANIEIHEGFKHRFYYNDIAMLTLNEEVQFPGFNPVCLPDEQMSRKILTGLGTTVLGWGAKTRGALLSPVLMKVPFLPVISNTKCNQLFHKVAPGFRRAFPKGITDDILCTVTEERGQGACSGDSGGPLMLYYHDHWIAVGLVSFGIDCGRPGYPSGYTRISAHMDWIRKKMQT